MKKFSQILSEEWMVSVPDLFSSTRRVDVFKNPSLSELSSELDSWKDGMGARGIVFHNGSDIAVWDGIQGVFHSMMAEKLHLGHEWIGVILHPAKAKLVSLATIPDYHPILLNNKKQAGFFQLAEIVKKCPQFPSIYGRDFKVDVFGTLV